MSSIRTGTISMIRCSDEHRILAPFDRFSVVMPALVAGIHVLGRCQKNKTWMAGTSPAMTRREYRKNLGS